MNGKVGEAVIVNGNRGQVVRAFDSRQGTSAKARMVAYTEVAFDNGRHTVYPNAEVHKVKA